MSRSESNAGQGDLTRHNGGDPVNEKAALEKEIHELRRMAQYRSLFLARLAHELRTPLTSILGFSEILLSQEKLTDSQKNFCERIQSSAHQLRNSLTQLADLSRLEAHQSELFLEELALPDVLSDSVQSLTRQAEKHRVEIKTTPLDSLPMIVTDRGKLRQVLYNFISYAIARSPSDEVVAIAMSANPNGVAITIADEGEWIPEPERFAQPEDLDPRTGSELGLAIARRLIDLLGAELIVQKRQPRGLEFAIQLPNITPPPSA